MNEIDLETISKNDLATIIIKKDNLIKKQQEETKRLHSIIKEVREYIENIPDDEFVESEHFTELLEILDKEK